jgi:hypothetical protein
MERILKFGNCMSERGRGFSEKIVQSKKEDRGSTLDKRLPIAEYAEKIRENLLNQPTFLLIGETGFRKNYAVTPNNVGNFAVRYAYSNYSASKIGGKICI